MERLIVMGSSTGGVAALRQIVGALPGPLAVPMLIVQHIGAHHSVLPELLSRPDMRVQHAADGERPRPGDVLVAPPDRHLIVQDGRVRLTRGAKEHHTRPAIDPLFRTAALAHRQGVLGVVLTGDLDDGVSGLQAIQLMGGTTIVQDPREAVMPSMPRSAMRHCRIDHCVRLEEMAPLLTRLAADSPRSEAVPGSDATSAAGERELVNEVDVTLGLGDPMASLDAVGHPSRFACPDCHGVLWQIQGATPRRYRCHTGHAFTERTLRRAMAEASDETLWNALRAVQEQHRLLEILAAEADDAEAAARQQLRSISRSLEERMDALRRFIDDRPVDESAAED